MLRKSFMRAYLHCAYALPQHTIERLSLLLVVLVSSLFYTAIRTVGGGEDLIAVLEVRLTEFAIEMPTTVPPGRVTFSVTNAGTMEHNFEVEGEGIEKKFDTNLKPGETRHLQVDLPTGTYTVYCSVNNYKERGMQLELKVAQQRSDRVMPRAISSGIPSVTQLYRFTASLIF
jgi:plastocyanin